MKYFSTHRPIGPGSVPKPEGNKILNVVNFGERIFCQEIGWKAWGYIEYERPLSDKDAKDYELFADGGLWYPVTVTSLKRGGGIKVTSGQVVCALQRPGDEKGETAKTEYKTRYFNSQDEAQRIVDTIQCIDITIERVRMSATQGEVRVYINGKYILNFGDNIVLPKHGDNLEDYYGDDIGGWRSNKPDSSFVLGLIWHPFDYVYHYSDMVCKAFGITQDEWIEGEQLG